MEPHLGELGFRGKRAKELWHFGTVGTGNKVMGWTVPKNASFVWMTCLGGGGGGGAGFSAASGSAKGGGAGGGAAGISRLWIPASLLPKQLYLWAGNGGRGGQTSGNGGTGGTHSFITDVTTTAPLTSGILNVLLCSGTNVAGGGGAGTAAGSGAGGAAETIAAFAGALIGPVPSLGMFQANPGPQAGATSSISGAANGITWANSGDQPSPCSAGCAGGGASAANAVFASGNQFAIPNQSNVYSSVAVAGVVGGPGVDGVSGICQLSTRTNLTQMMLLGGTGGGSCATAGTGGRGGNGAYGCGGAGGGAGVTGGAGGDGGPGFIYVCWI